MKNLPSAPSIVLVGRDAAERAAWLDAWSGADAVSSRDLQVDAPTASEPAPALCLLIGSDGRDGADATEATARLALQRAGWPYSVLRGALADQLDTARRAWQAAQRERLPVPTRWRHICGRCGDGDCERTLFDDRHGPASTAD
jgi:hypothetical protein